MSDVKADNQGSTPGTEGRMLSRARRQALSHGGKASLPQTQSAKPAVRGHVRPSAPAPVQARVESAARPASPSPVSLSPANSLPAKTADHTDNRSHERRSNEARSNDNGDCTHSAEANTLEAVCALVESEPQALGASASGVRELCRARRQARSSQGKSAQELRNKNGAARRHGQQPNKLSGREAAQARRETLCLNGRGNSPACRPAGRVRATSPAPIKVEQGNTLSGNLITGTQLERTSKVTGIEGGICRAITGTEYIGAEQYGALCASTPAPAPAKVGVGSTSRGQRVTGTELGSSKQVTGDDHGACQSVTGDEYLSSEQFVSFCGTKSTPGPAKVGISTTSTGQRVSGSDVGRSSKVTGDELGACAKLTGSEYYVPDESGSVCQGSGVPHKVSVMSTVRGRPVTGTDLSASKGVTGSEYGACSGVTGAEYAGLQQYQACNRDPVLTPEKVTVMRTWHEQSVSGTSVEHNPKVTGDEYGGCQPISGTEYIGPGQYASSCPADSLSASRDRLAPPSGVAGARMTGVSTTTSNKVTGSARGQAQHLSGSAYSDSAKLVQPATAGLSQHPLARGPVGRGATSQPSTVVERIVARPTTPMQSNFSVMSPARTAQASELNRVTGTASSTQGRITGPVNLAAGLVSGTPEFRYREDSVAPAPVAQAPAPQASAQTTTPPNRVTGGGRESGFAITGAAWQRDGSITGTEGSAATRRNPTQRGDAVQRSDPRSMAMPFPAMKELEHVQVPPSKITGSSGNAASGSAITYSGGARG
jgi:hypothetical protein